MMARPQMRLPHRGREEDDHMKKIFLLLGATVLPAGASVAAEPSAAVESKRPPPTKIKRADLGRVRGGVGASEGKLKGGPNVEPGKWRPGKLSFDKQAPAGKVFPKVAPGKVGLEGKVFPKVNPTRVFPKVSPERKDKWSPQMKYRPGGKVLPPAPGGKVSGGSNN
jgi:hypothetical protein